MILRLVRGTLAEADASALIGQLRNSAPGPSQSSAGLALVYGFRRIGADVEFLTLSAWLTFDALSSALGGDIERPLPGFNQRIPGELSTSHYELADNRIDDPADLDASVIGIVTGRIKANEEGAVHAMIRNVEEEVRAAGVVNLHIGRRVARGRTHLVVLALWRDRAALHRFARNRGRPTIDPGFTERLEDFDFRTYDSVTLRRLAVPATGPAILLAQDDRSYVDASPGFEAVFGVPGELILRRRVEDLTSPAMRDRVPRLWSEFLAKGSMEGTFLLQRLDGSVAPVGFRAQTNLPADGVHASVFDVPGLPRDERSVSEIVAEAFPAREQAAA